MEQLEAMTETQATVIDEISTYAVSVIVHLGKRMEQGLAEKDAVIRHLAGMLANSIVPPHDYARQIHKELADPSIGQGTRIMSLLESWRPEVPKSLVDGE